MNHGLKVILGTNGGMKISMELNGISQPKPKHSLWEILFAVLVLFLATDAVIPLLQMKREIVFNPVEGNITLQALWLSIYMITALLLLFHWRQMVPIVRQNYWVLSLIGLAFISIAWSEVPMMTLRRSIALLGTTAFGIYLAIRYSPMELLKLLAGVLGLIAVLSLGFVLLLPEYALHEDGNWRGIYINKNFLGSMMSLAAITWLVYFLCTSKVHLVAVGFCGFSVALLLLSNSITSIFILLMLLSVLVLYGLFQWPRMRNPGPVILIVLTVLGLTIMLVTNLDILLFALGRNETLSGRTELWKAIGEVIQQRPWTGYGFGAFWLGSEGMSGYIGQLLHWYPGHAHNGFLDIWLQLGLVGVILFTITLIRNLFKALILAWREKGLVSMVPLLLLLFMTLHNITESTFMKQNNFFWILFTVVTVQLGIRYGEAGDKKGENC